MASWNHCRSRSSARIADAGRSRPASAVITFVVRNQVDNRRFGQRGRLVQNEPRPVLDPCSERAHVATVRVCWARRQRSRDVTKPTGAPFPSACRTFTRRRLPVLCNWLQESASNEAAAAIRGLEFRLRLRANIRRPRNIADQGCARSTPRSVRLAKFGCPRNRDSVGSSRTAESDAAMT